MFPWQGYWDAAVTAFENGNYVAGVGYSLDTLVYGMLLVAPAATSPLVQEAFSHGLGSGIAEAATDPNKLYHIFGQVKHNLDPLVTQFGSQENAFNALQKATEAAVRSQGLSGVFEIIVNVGTETVTVRGNIIKGIVKIGTAFIP